MSNRLGITLSTRLDTNLRTIHGQLKVLQGQISKTPININIKADTRQVVGAANQASNAMRGVGTAAQQGGQQAGNMFNDMSRRLKELQAQGRNTAAQVQFFKDRGLREEANRLNATLRGLNITKGMTADQMKQVIHQAKLLKTDLSQVNTSARHAGKASLQLGERFKIAAESFAQWITVTGVFFFAMRQFRQAIQTVRDFDAALLGVNKVLNLTDAQMKQLTKSAFDVGKQIGVLGTEVVDATAAFGRMGYQLEEALDLAQDALLLRNVGTGIDSVEQATESLIATMKGYNFEASESRRIIDAVNEVSNNYAVDARDLAEGIKRTAAVFSQANVSFEEGLGLIVGATEVMQDAEKASTALRTITLRMRGVKEAFDEAEDSVVILANMEESLKKYADIDLRESTGAFRSQYEILRELSEVWDTLEDDQRALIVTQAAGVRQAVAFNALMTNMDSVLGSTETALKSKGSALLENDKYLESINGRVAIFNASVQDMWVKTINSDTIKNLVDFGTAIIGLADGIGLLNIAIGVLTVKMTNFLGAGLITKFANQLGVLALQKGATVAAAGALKVALIKLMPLLAGVAVVGGLVWHLSNLEDATSKALSAAEDLVEGMERQQRAIGELSDRYSYLATREKLTIEQEIQLINLQDQLFEKFGAAALQVDLLNGEYEKNIQLIKEMQRLKLEEDMKKLNEQYEELKAQVPELRRESTMLGDQFHAAFSLKLQGVDDVEERINILRSSLGEYGGRFDEIIKRQIRDWLEYRNRLNGIRIGLNNMAGGFNNATRAARGLIETMYDLQVAAGPWARAGMVPPGMSEEEFLAFVKTPSGIHKRKTPEDGVDDDGGGGSARTDDYRATINAFEAMENALENIRVSLQRNSILMDETFGEGTIPLLQERVDLLTQQKNISNDLISARQREIRDNLKIIESYGVQYKYNKDNHEVTMDYQNTLAQLSGTEARRLEEAVKRILDLNKQNQRTQLDILGTARDIRSEYAAIASVYEQNIIGQINDHIEGIERRIKAEEDYYSKRIAGIDAQIDAQRVANQQVDDELRRQQLILDIERARDRLARVTRERNVRLFRDGQWEWVADPREVEKAQNDLSNATEAHRKFELDLERRYQEESLRTQKVALETQRNNIIDSLRAQINFMRDHIRNIEKLEDESYDKRVEMLKDFVARYNAEMAKLQQPQINMPSIPRAPSTPSGSTGTIPDATVTVRFSDGEVARGVAVNGETFVDGVSVRNDPRGGVVTADSSGRAYAFAGDGTKGVRQFAVGGKKIGDGLAYLHNNEHVLTEKQGEHWETLVDNLPNLVAGMMKATSGIKMTGGDVASTTNSNNYYLNDITIKADRPDEFFRKLKDLAVTTR